MLEGFLGSLSILLGNRGGRHVLLVLARALGTVVAQLASYLSINTNATHCLGLVGRFACHSRNSKGLVQLLAIDQFIHPSLPLLSKDLAKRCFVNLLRRLHHCDSQLLTHHLSRRLPERLGIALRYNGFASRELSTLAQLLTRHDFGRESTIKDAHITAVFLVFLGCKAYIFGLELIDWPHFLEVSTRRKLVDVFLGQGFIIITIAVDTIRIILTQVSLLARLCADESLIFDDKHRLGINITANQPVNILACTLARHQARHNGKAANRDSDTGKQGTHLGSAQVAASAANDISRLHG